MRRSTVTPVGIHHLGSDELCNGLAQRLDAGSRFQRVGSEEVVGAGPILPSTHINDPLRDGATMSASSQPAFARYPDVLPP